MMAAVRAKTGVFNHDLSRIGEILRAVLPEKAGGGGEDAADDEAIEAAEFFKRVFANIGALERVPQDGSGFNGIDNAVGRLCLLENVATSAEGRQRGAHWRAVCIAVLERLNIHSEVRGLDVTGYFEPPPLQASAVRELAIAVLRRLELVLLTNYLLPSRGVSSSDSLANRLQEMLASVRSASFTPSLTCAGLAGLAGFRPDAKELESLSAALDCDLYSGSGMKETAMRYLVQRGSILLASKAAADASGGGGRVGTRQTASFKRDWTVEHVVPQSDLASDVATRSFFSTAPVGGRGAPLHRLGNLTPEKSVPGFSPQHLAPSPQR